jgi:hypothetical protein
MNDDSNTKVSSYGKMFRPRNMVFVLGTLLAVWVAQFAYRQNNICSPGEHILQSDTDAIEVAKTRLVKDPFFSSEEFGSALDFLDALCQTRNCCEVTRRRALFLVTMWDVYLVAETPTKRLIAMMGLSNCGAILAETKFKAIEPR